MKRYSKRSIYSILFCLSLLFPPETHCAYMLALKTAGKYVANLFLQKGGQEIAKKAAPAAAGVAASYFLKPSQISTAPAKAPTAPAAAPMKTNAASSVQANSKLDSPTFKKTLSKTLPAATQTKVEPKSGTQALSQDKAAPLSSKSTDKLHNTKVLKAAAEKALTTNHKTTDATLSTGQSQSNAKLDTAPKAKDFSRDVGIKADGIQKSAGDLSQVDRIKPGSPATTGSFKKRAGIQLSEQRKDVLRLFEKAKRTGDPAAVDEWKSAFTSFKETYGIEAHSYSEPKVIGFGDPNKPYQVFENQYPDLPARPAVPTKPSPEPSKIKPNDLPPKPNVPVAPRKPDTPKQPTVPVKSKKTPNGIPYYVRPQTVYSPIIDPRQLIDLLEKQAHTPHEEGRRREEERIEQSDKRRDRIKIFVEGPVQFNLEKQGSQEKPDSSDKVTPQQEGDNQPKKPDDEEKNNNVAKAAAGEALGLDALKKLKNKSNASGSKSNSNGNGSAYGSTRAGSTTDDSLKKLKTNGQTQASPDNSKIEPAKSVTDGNKLTGNNERVPVDRQARYAKADKGWNLSENGSFIEHVDKNGKTYQRYHSKHALEKMAPDTPEVRAVLERRAAEKGIPKYKVNGELNSDWVSATTPRDIPPSVVEDVIQTAKPVFNEEHGTWSYITDEIKLALDKPDGDVLTVFRRTRRNNGI